MKTFNELTEELLTEAKGLDKKTANQIARMNLRTKVDYNFQYFISKEQKSELWVAPRGVSATKPGHFGDVFKAILDVDVYLDGPSVVMGDKTVGKWQGKTFSDIYKMVGLRLEK